MITGIVTCKGRLEHLKQSLPTLLAACDEVVVVDYDCPDHAGDWVAASYPDAVVVRVEDRPLFNRSIARNLGAAAAHGDWLLFVDADVCISPAFAVLAPGLAQPGAFVLPQPRTPPLCGLVLTTRADFLAIGGFDEVFEGWGAEDFDLTGRLQRSGLRPLSVDAGLFTPIAHDDALRIAHQEIKDLVANGTINGLYRAVKRDLTLLGVPPDLGKRRRIYASIRAALARRDPARRISFTCREEDLLGPVQAQTTLTYELRGAVAFPEDPRD